MARLERVLTKDEAEATRIMTYPLQPGQRLSFPIEPGTEVFRVIAHAFRRGTIESREHATRIIADIDGASRVRHDTFAFLASGISERAFAEDPDMAVGAPMAFNVDAHASGRGTLTLALESVEEADGVLVRVYKREAVGVLAAFARIANLSEFKRGKLARRSGQIDWIDQTAEAQATLLGARWRKVGAIAGSQVFPVPISLRPASVRPWLQPATRLAQLDLAAGEKIIGRVAGPTTLNVKGALATMLELTTTDAQNLTRRVERLGQIGIDIAAGSTTAFEVASASPDNVEVSCSNACLASLAHRVEYYRTSSARPVVVQAGATSVVLRVVARARVLRSASSSAVGVVLVLTGANGVIGTRTLQQTLARSAVDRYLDGDPEHAPSEPWVFHVVVPKWGSATFHPVEGEVEFAISELDPRAGPRWTEPGGHSARRSETEDGDLRRFVPRRPSNVDTFGPGDRGLLRIAERRTPKNESPTLSVGRAVRPRDAMTMFRAGKRWIRADHPLTIDVPDRGPLFLPLWFYSNERRSVVAMIDGGHPRRRTLGMAQRLTTSIGVVVEGDAKAGLVLGDDLVPGRHSLSFTTEDQTPVWVRVPWVRIKSHPPESRWVVGDRGP